MDIRCLGPLEAEVNGSPVDLGGSQQRHVLAVLVSRVGRSVSTDALVDDLWPDRTPDTARKTVQGYVSVLRRALPDGALVSTSNGYALATGDTAIDASRFERQVNEAADLPEPESEGAALLLREALALWRGEPYEGITESDLLRPEVIRLSEMHAAAQEALARALLFSGREAEAVSQLADLARGEPLRERRWTLWALALYRTGRQTEALRVLDDARRTLATGAGLDPSRELLTMEQRIIDQDPVLDGYNALDAVPPGSTSDRRNPYKGLRPFGEDDAADFFGRNAFVRRLLEAVTARRARRLHIVAGPSGSGKSSLVRAGLTPALRRLGRRVRVEYPNSSSPEDHDGLDVLIIDQLEEVFVSSGSAADSYLNAVMDIVESVSGPAVVVTVRSDVLDQILTHERFAPHVEGSLLLVTPLDDHELREIITGPAARVGVGVDPDLVAAIVADAKREVSSLPLIQFALTDLFDRTTGTTMTLEGLAAAGGIGAALNRRAEETLAGLGEDADAGARNVFLRLVSIGDDGLTFRRRASLDAIESLDGGRRTVEAFRANRLMTTDRDREGRRTAEIAHESLLNEWHRMAGWIDAARDALWRHRQLAEAATEWESRGRANSHLLTGARLARLSDRSGDDIALSTSESDFLDESQQYAERQARTLQRRRVAITTAFGVVAAVAIVLAAMASSSRNRARDNASAAEAKALSSAASVATAEDPQLGILLALQAMLTNPSTDPTIEERLTLRTAVQADRLVAAMPLTEPDSFKGIDLSPDGTQLAVRSYGELKILDTSTWIEEWTYVDPQMDTAVAFSPDGDLVATGALNVPEAPYVTVLDAHTGDIVETVTFDDAGCVAIVTPQAWSHDSSFLAVGVWQNCGNPSTTSTRILDTERWEVVEQIEGEYNAQFAEAAPRLLLVESFTDPPRLLIYETDPFVQIGEFTGNVGDISPDGGLIAAIDNNNAPNLIVVDDADSFDRLVGLDYRPSLLGTDYLAIGPPEGTEAPPALLVAVGTDGQTTNIWSVASGQVVFSLPTGAVQYLAHDEVRDLLYTAGYDGLLQIWDLSPGGLASPDQLTFPYWFDANAFRTNPLSTMGSVYHDDLPRGVRTYATFDTETGRLLDTSVVEIAETTSVVAALPGERFLYVAGNRADEEAGPVVAGRANGDVDATVVGCVGPVSDWRFILEEEASCLDGGSPFVAAEDLEVSANGTEIGAVDADGVLHVWDAATLKKTLTVDISDQLTTDVLDPFLDGVRPGDDELEDVLGAFAVMRRFTDDWIIVQSTAGYTVVLSRPNLNTVAAFDMLMHPWGVEIAHDESFVLLSSVAGIHRVDTADWAASLIIPSASTIRGIALSNDDRRVMLGSTDGLVHIHDTNSGDLLDQVSEASVSDGLWIDDDRIVIATGETGTWKTLDLDIRSVALRALDQLTRGLTDAECTLYDIDPCPSLEDMRRQLELLS